MNDGLLVRKMRVENEMGLHARPAALLVQAVEGLNCDISLEKDGEKVNGKSIMGIMILAAERGSEIIVSARGPDAERAMQEIGRVVSGNYGKG
ncbi:MAG TPA: HPr family phosphocarrier protein [Firmicutes bacterium]|nr:HPr family phosphocarrier protein [Bacillota bacterium]